MIERPKVSRRGTLLGALVILTTFCVALFAPDAFALSESERVGMEFRVGYSYQMLEDIGSGPGYGVRVLFVSPHGLSGYIGGQIYTSHGEPLGEVREPGWSLIDAESTIYIMPAVIGATYVVHANRTNFYVGGGPAWVNIHERTKARFVSGDWVMTEWINNSASGFGVHLSLGIRYLYSPRLSAFLEIEGLTSWIDYGRREKINPRSVSLFTGIRF